MKLVFLDRKSLGTDIDLSSFRRFGDVVMYDFSTPKQVAERLLDADIAIINKSLINESTIGHAKNLKLICVTATGINNLDTDYLAKRNIAWRNVAGYSTESVAQHTFALLFYLYEHLPYYDNYVKSGQYIQDYSFTHFEKHFPELYGKTWGIIGLGAIGKRVATIASAFGCRVLYYSTSGFHHDTQFTETDFDTLLTSSDILSIHAPLNEKTQGLIQKDALRKMKSSAILLNLGRGPIINESDLYDALLHHEIAAAGLDVLTKEPMSENNPLFKLKDNNRLLITPHIGWAATEARMRLMKIIEGQIADFLNGCL